MSIEPKMFTLKVNIRAQEERERREKERQLAEAISKIQSTQGPPPKPRKKRGLNFHQPGTFIAKGEQIRRRARVEALQRKIAERAAQTGIANAAKLASLITDTSETRASKSSSEPGGDVTKQFLDEEVPDVEWWDKPILGRQALDEVVPKLAQDIVKPEQIFHGITNLVEHPPIKQAPGLDSSNVQIPIFLTKDERKKLRRQNRKNRELEKQEKIKLGFLPKPEPKLKRSNIMYALGDEAITNPSLADKMVKEQEQKRLQAHKEHNESKKLSLEEKRAKKLRKVQEDVTITGLWVSVYRILNVTKQSPRLKIVSKNAKQLTMTGVIVSCRDFSLVVVEGGPKQQRKFKHLILDRMKWADKAMTESARSSPTVSLVWEGDVTKRAFSYVKVKQFDDEQDARKYFREFNVEHYLDLTFKMSKLESIDDLHK